MKENEAQNLGGDKKQNQEIDPKKLEKLMKKFGDDEEKYKNALKENVREQIQEDLNNSGVIKEYYGQVRITKVEIQNLKKEVGNNKRTTLLDQEDIKLKEKVGEAEKNRQKQYNTKLERRIDDGTITKSKAKKLKTLPINEQIIYLDNLDKRDREILGRKEKGKINQKEIDKIMIMEPIYAIEYLDSLHRRDELLQTCLRERLISEKDTQKIMKFEPEYAVRYLDSVLRTKALSTKLIKDGTISQEEMNKIMKFEPEYAVRYLDGIGSRAYLIKEHKQEFSEEEILRVMAMDPIYAGEYLNAKFMILLRLNSLVSDGKITKQQAEDIKKLDPIYTKRERLLDKAYSEAKKI